MTHENSMPSPTRGAEPSAAWEGGKCRVPMWCVGVPAGHCGEAALGPQLPKAVLRETRNWPDAPYCFGPCCPKHGGPREGEPILFTDGRTPEGRPMWCAVMPGFIDLQVSEAGCDGNPLVALANLRAALAKGRPTSPPRTPPNLGDKSREEISLLNPLLAKGTGE